MQKNDMKVLMSSNSDEWTTPDDLFKELNRNFSFTLDTATNGENSKCDKFFTPSENGLIQSWEGERTFTNPPHSIISDWVKKNYEESKKDTQPKVMLIPARTDTQYFSKYCSLASNLYFIKGRLKFSDSKNSAPFPSVIVVFHSLREGTRNVQWCDKEFKEFW
jgi:site-specific DNA-methyltransferase (adenine-specific)